MTPEPVFPFCRSSRVIAPPGTHTLQLKALQKRREKSHRQNGIGSVCVCVCVCVWCCNFQPCINSCICDLPVVRIYGLLGKDDMAPGDVTTSNKCKEFETTNDCVSQATNPPGTFPLDSISRENSTVFFFFSFFFKPLDWQDVGSLCYISLTYSK